MTPTDETNFRGLSPTETFIGGGEMGDRMRQFDWTQSPLGPVERWPVSLRSTVNICLNSRYPLFIWWGSEHCILYNDAYLPTLGVRHPHALGRPGHEVWPEIWPIIGPMLKRVLESANATWSDDQFLLLNRSGFPEETYHTFSYSPIRVSGGSIGGVFTAVTETTKKVIGERRLKLLNELAHEATGALNLAAAVERAFEVVAKNSADLPFLDIYLLERKERLSLDRFLRADGGPITHFELPPQINLNSAEGVSAFLVSSFKNKKLVTIENGIRPAHTSEDIFRNRSIQSLVSLPLTGPDQAATGVVVCGVSALLPLNEDYLSFLGLVSGQLSSIILNAQSYEDQKRRAEELAELDRAKTTFFSNISHEFRTPLTLMLGPLEDCLSDDEHSLPAVHRERLALTYRNALRLLKLVNSLLDFSRIEAGKVKAAFRSVNLSKLTIDLCSVFRAAIEKAGLSLKVEIPALSKPVYVDPDMWEKIVLNLLSNAFKFTLRGEIRVSLSESNSEIEFCVSDTGLGIPETEMPRLFERFHRIEGAKGRSHEGSGIGLALIQELVQLHKGKIFAESRVGVGSTFKVTIPFGAAHLPPEKIIPASDLFKSPAAMSLVDEASRWTSDPKQDSEKPPFDFLSSIAKENNSATKFIGTQNEERILLADDNADMRNYVKQLLSEYWRIETAGDGEAALQSAINAPPALILADVMMPKMDGFELLKHLRANEKTRTVPVVLLSARAGEESRIEGLQAGADDYLVKPFSAKELVARVQSSLKVSRIRNEASEKIKLSEQLLRNRSAELERSNIELAEFAFAASHDLKEPLRVVSNYVQMLEILYRGKLDDKAQTYITFIVDGIRRMYALINDLLSYSRIGAEAAEMEPCDFNVLVAAALANLKIAIEESHAQVTVEHLPFLDADPTQMIQLFQNLIGNAIKYRSATRSPEIKVSAVQENGNWKFEITDNGIGIEPQYFDRIFVLFQRLHSKEEYSGTGIGLSMCKKIVERHGGKLWLESTLHVGTRFYFTFST